MQKIKTIQEAEEIRKEYPYMYLVVFVINRGQTGSAIVTMREDAPLWKVYFTFNEINKEKETLIITNVIKL